MSYIGTKQMPEYFLILYIFKNFGHHKNYLRSPTILSYLGKDIGYGNETNKNPVTLNLHSYLGKRKS